VIRSIGQNMALNNGAYAMSGESIKTPTPLSECRKFSPVF
jgi:hypothetical protein